MRARGDEILMTIETSEALKTLFFSFPMQYRMSSRETSDVENEGIVMDKFSRVLAHRTNTVKSISCTMDMKYYPTAVGFKSNM